MMRDPIRPTRRPEARLSRSELFDELARIHKCSWLRPGPAAGEKVASHRNGAPEARPPAAPIRVWLRA